MRMKVAGVPIESMTTVGPYKLYTADLYVCPLCDKEVFAGFGQAPIIEHFDPEYQATVNRYRRKLSVFRYWLNQREKEEFEANQS